MAWFYLGCKPLGAPGLSRDTAKTTVARILDMRDDLLGSSISLHTLVGDMIFSC